MIKRVFATMVVIAAMFAGYSTYNEQDETNNEIIVNVEALANNESDNAEETWQVGDKIVRKEIYTTTVPGWTWNAEIDVLLLNGKVSGSAPPSYVKETTEVKIKCCRLQGDLNKCEYESC